MSEFLTDEWFERVTTLAADLPSASESDVEIGLEVAGAPAGKIRGRFQLIGGRLTAGTGKPADPDCSVVLKYPDAVALVDGSLHPDVGFMQGRLKIDGDYHRLVFDLRRWFESPEIADLVATLRAETTY